MKIDWKHLATTPGYISLKAAYIHDVMESEKTRARGHSPMRDKAEFLHKFNWVINRAKHYAERTGQEMEKILDAWEAKRNYWWLNYYQDCNQSKFDSGNHWKRANLRKVFKREMKQRWSNPKSKLGRRNRLLEMINEQDGIHPPRTKKARWSKEKKVWAKKQRLKNL